MIRFAILIFLATTVVRANFLSFLWNPESSTPEPPTVPSLPEVLRCTDVNGTLVPSATTCKDELSQDHCDSFFKPGNSGYRNPNCNSLLFRDIAMKCAKTCAICCEHPNHRCEDSPTYAFLCPTIKRTCKVENEDVRKAMVRMCPKSCGFCDLIERAQ